MFIYYRTLECQVRKTLRSTLKLVVKIGRMKNRKNEQEEATQNVSYVVLREKIITSYTYLHVWQNLTAQAGNFENEFVC